MIQDNYDILGVNPNATDEEVKKARNRFAQKYHPDNFANASDEVKKQAEEKMKEINTAYDAIKEERSRPKPPPIDDFPFPPNIIEIILGGRNRQRQTAYNPVRGADLRYDLDIEFEEAAFGKETTVRVPRLETCTHCNGKCGADLETCPDCHGSGQRITFRNDPFGFMQSAKTCERCHGRWKIIKTSCHHCHGEGKVKSNRKISLKIPKGVDTGARIRVKDGGNAGDNGGGYGDLYVYIHIKPHRIFQRKGNDIYCEESISFVQAALGTTIEVPTIDGKVKLDIPAGIQPDTVQKIKGKGVPYLRGEGRGDEYVTIKVITPKNLSARQKKILKQFESSNDETQSEKKSLFDSLKNFFSNVHLKLASN